MDLNAIIALVAFVLSIVLGITLFSLAPRHLIGRVFIIGILFLLVVQFSLFMIFLQKDKILFWGKVAMASFCFLPPTWALISLVYGRTNYRELLKNRISYLSIIFAIGLAFFVLLWIFDFFSVHSTFPKDIFLISNLGKYFLVFALLSAVLVLINFENTLRLAKISSRKEKKFPLYVLTCAFLFWVYALSQMLIYSRISSRLVMAGCIIIIVTNIILIFYSIKYGVMQLEVSLGREVIYSSAMIFIVGIYLLIIGIASKIVQYAGGSVNLFLTFLAALVMFFVFLALLVSKSLKKRVKIFIDRNFYKHEYDYREQWGKFSESLSAVLTFDEVLDTVIENITEIFSTNEAAILLTDENAKEITVRKTKNISKPHEMKFNQNSEFIDWLHRLGEAVEVTTLTNEPKQIGLTANEIKNLEKLQAVVCVPMILQQKFMGIITIGAKDQKDLYSRKDFDLLETLANQSSVAILNAKLNEELMISREMESFHKLSSFIIHDLRNSVSMLSMVINNAETNWDNQEFQKDMMITISNTTTKMKSLISKISSLPDKFETMKRNVQLNNIIENIIRETKIEKLEKIDVKKNLQYLPAFAVDPDQIQKVIENLIVNALEAMPHGGGTLSISTRSVSEYNNANSGNGRGRSENGMAEITISDTGIGMDQEFIHNRLFKPFQTTKKKGLGIGLYHSKEIILAHNGKIEVTSKINEGTTFRILLPILNNIVSVKETQQLTYKNELILN